MTTATKIFALVLLFSLAFARDIKNFPGRGDRSQARITGGTAVTDVNAYPYVVGVLQVTKDWIAFFGHGTIINKFFVLTTASVASEIQNMNKTEVKLISNCLVTYPLTSGILHNVVSAIFHSYSYNVDDVGLIKACPGFVTSNFAVLPQPGQLFAGGTPVVIPGWGELDTLGELHLVLDSAANCEREFINYNISTYNATKDLCLIKESNKSTCRNDYGEGIFVGTTIIGITSLFKPCNLESVEAQTFIAPYVQWILENSVY